MLDEFELELLELFDDELLDELELELLELFDDELELELLELILGAAAGAGAGGGAVAATVVGGFVDAVAVGATDVGAAVVAAAVVVGRSLVVVDVELSMIGAGGPSPSSSARIAPVVTVATTPTAPAAPTRNAHLGRRVGRIQQPCGAGMSDAWGQHENALRCCGRRRAAIRVLRSARSSARRRCASPPPWA